LRCCSAADAGVAGRLGGSIALGAAARSLLLLARDPDGPEGAAGTGRVLAQAKSNLGQLETSCAYRIQTKAVDKKVKAAYLKPIGASRFSAVELLALNEPEARSKLSEAEAMLRVELEGGPRAVSELRAAAVELGISITTLDRAKKQLGARSVKLGFGNWAWELSETDGSDAEVAAA
jgi:hypothetical protein